MSARLFAIAFVATGSMLGIACSLFVSIPDSLTDGHGAADAEAGSPGSPQSDAGDSGGARVDLCGDAAFCDDFDHGPAFSRWDTVLNGPGLDAVLDGTFTTSTPSALLARIDKSVTDDCAYAGLEKRLSGSFTQSTLGVSLRAEGPEVLNEGALAVTDITSPAGMCAVLTGFQWTGSNYALSFHEQVVVGSNVQDTTHDSSLHIPKQSWQRIGVHVDYVAKEIALDANGKTERFALERACPFAPGTAGLRVGFHCSQRQALTREMRADDVVFDAH
jgi:hypothetical protein